MSSEAMKMKKKDGKVPFFPNKALKVLVFQTNVRE